MKKILSLLSLALIFSMALAGCNQNGDGDSEVAVAVVDGNVDWISPMVSFNIDGTTASVWDSQYDLHRNETFEYVFRLDGVEVPITEEALLSGGAVPATVNLSYGGAGEYLSRLVVFAYEFFDHGRPARIAAHAAAPNPADIMVLWRNPKNNHWFNLIQDGIGRTHATQGYHNDELLSLVRETPQYTFRLNSETIQDISELELFIVATARPTREDEYERSGYSLTFTIELPDIDHHFHSWELLVASGTMIIVEE